MKETSKSRHRIPFSDSLHMTAAHLNAHTSATWTERRRANPCHILRQRKRGTAAQEAKGLTITLIDFHTCHTRIVLGCGYEIHPEGGTQIRLIVDYLSYLFYIHLLKQ
jgi:hypothetical protein